jgi:phosphoenolpyruvate-protein phosphotransferase
VEAEHLLLDEATAGISDDLLRLASRVEAEFDGRLSEIFGAHQLLARDASLREEVREEIAKNLVTACSAVKTVFRRWEKRFLLMKSQISRDKSDDVRDVSIRLRHKLNGIHVHPLERFPSGGVLAARRLLPSDTIFLGRGAASAVLLEYGSSSSHAALFAREIGLPCISGLSGLLDVVSRDELALVDACTGVVRLEPSSKQRTAFRKKVVAAAKTRRAMRDQAQGPAITADGTRISVLANVGCREDTETAIHNGAEGIGLYRIEQAYLGRAAPPSADELEHEMRHTLAPVRGRPVYVRLLDVGGDKLLPYLGNCAESNPALGRRGIRLLREYPQLLETQLRVIVQLQNTFDVRIVVPMVTLPDDVAAVRAELLRLTAKMPEAELVQLGAMIETPAAALSVREIVRHADFLSFGTNDLTQYVFAADRENASVERYFDDAAPAIFRLLRIGQQDAPGVPLSVCGELAGRSKHVEALLQSGVRTLSVAPSLVAAVKAAVRTSRCELKTFTDSRRSIRSPFRNAVTAVDDPQ